MLQWKLHTYVVERSMKISNSGSKIREQVSIWRDRDELMKYLASCWKNARTHAPDLNIYRVRARSVLCGRWKKLIFQLERSCERNVTYHLSLETWNHDFISTFYTQLRTMWTYFISFCQRDIYPTFFSIMRKATIAVNQELGLLYTYRQNWEL